MSSADAPPPAIAIAVAVPQGSVSSPGVVQATALGAPVPQAARTHSGSLNAVGEAAGPADSAVVAEAFVYTPLMAKVSRCGVLHTFWSCRLATLDRDCGLRWQVFAGLDADHSGFLEMDEVEALRMSLAERGLD